MRAHAVHTVVEFNAALQKQFINITEIVLRRLVSEFLILDFHFDVVDAYERRTENLVPNDHFIFSQFRTYFMLNSKQFSGSCQRRRLEMMMAMRSKIQHLLKQHKIGIKFITGFVENHMVLFD